MSIRSVVIANLVVLCLAADASAYCLDKFPGATNFASWAGVPIKYRVSDSLKDAALAAALDKAFATWGAINCSSLAFTKDTAFAISAVPWQTATTHINIYWATAAGEWPAGVATSNYVYYYLGSDTSSKAVTASFAINAFTYKWNATGGAADTFDVQNVLTYWIGRMVGLAESKVAGAVLADKPAYAQVTKQKLAQDDMDAATYLYTKPGCAAPAPPPATCPSGPPPPPTEAGPPKADSGPPKTDGTKPPTGDGTKPPVGDGAPPPKTDGAAPPKYDGASGKACVSSAQCASDEICTAEGKCLKVGGSEKKGCGCAVAERPGSAPRAFWLLALLGAVALASPRRRRRY